MNLVAPSIYVLHRMCDMTFDYASAYDINFNQSKCHMINCNDNINIVFNYDDVDLKAESKGTHLGHIIGSKFCSDILQDASYTLIRSVNYV